jgi:hypothetical protein
MTTGLPPLYMIGEEYQELLWLMAEGEIEESLFNEFIDDVSADFSKKSANVASFFLSLESQADEIKIAEQRMNARRKSLEKNAKKLRDYLLNQMQLINLKEISTPEFLIRIRNNPARVNIVSEALVPDGYKLEEVSIRLDKNAIKDSIKAGNPVPGAVLTQNQRLHVS